MTQEISNSCNKFQSLVFSSIRTISKTNNKKQITEISKSLQISDDAFSSFLEYIQGIQLDIGASYREKLKERLKNFQNSRVNSLLRLYSKTYAQFHSTIDHMEERTSILSNDFAKASINNRNALESMINQQKSKFNIMYNQKKQEHLNIVNNLKKRIEEARDSAHDRIMNETQRITEHYDKHILAKSDTLNMTKTALDKADTDLKEVIESHNQEITQAREKHESLLKEHRESINNKLFPDETSVLKLKEQFETLQKSHITIGPELEAEWEEISSKTKQKFTEQDQKFNSDIEEKQKIIDDYGKKIQDLEMQMMFFTEDSDSNYKKIASELEKQYQENTKQRESSIENSKREILSHYEAKYQRLVVSLESLRKSIEFEADSMKNKNSTSFINQEERIKALQEEHKKQSSEIKNLIQDTIEKISQAKIDWRTERKQLNDGYDQDLKDIALRDENGDRYFEAKMAALKKELHQVLEENRIAFGVEEPYDEELDEFQKQLKRSEELFAVRFKAELSEETHSKIQVKLGELREKHEKEIETILKESQSLDSNERLLLEKTSGLDGTTSSGVSLLASKKGLSKQARVSSVFNSSIFIEAQMDKWKENFFIDCKNLKQEEAAALKKLESSKHELKDAVVRTITLKKQLEATTSSYEESIAKLRNGSEADLSSLRQEIDRKEKEISDMEIQFQANEREVRKRVRQIELAEDRIQTLKVKLNEEKSKIKTRIKEDYQPLIKQEQRKSELMVSELEKLRNELELSIELMQHDLFGIETSNAAMEEGLKKETEELVSKLRQSLISEQESIDDIMNSTLSQIEMGHLDDINKAINDQYQIVEELKREQEQNIILVEKEYKEKVSVLNDICIEFLSEINDSKQKVKHLKDLKCEICPLLSKNIKKLEKHLIKIQIQDRDITLDEQNKIDTLHMLKGKSKLPPL